MMICRRWFGQGVVLALAGLLGGAAQAADVRTTAEIRINLPGDREPVVSVSPGNNRVVVELPRGADYPSDFAASSGGLLSRGQVVPLDDDRVRLELELAVGLLDRVTYEPGAVVLRFASRLDVQTRTSTQGLERYLLGADDVILMTVHGQPDLAAELTITREGYITAPLVGDVEAAGMSPRQLATRLADLLGRDYLVDPQVDVEVEDYRSQWVMVDGEIRLPGRVPLKGGTRLKEVLSEAGGFAESAGEKISISRKPLDGGTEVVSFEVERRAFESGDANPVLQHGDIVSISRAEYAFVQGEVGSPGRVRIERGTTLLKAVAQSGGLTDWANRREIQVLDPEGGKPRVFNLRRIQNGKAEDPQLRGGEVIVVKRRFF